MNRILNEREQGDLIVNSSFFTNQMMFLKMNTLEEQYFELEERVNKFEQGQRFQNVNQNIEFFQIQDENRKVKKSSVGSTCEVNGIQECEKIVERILEILNEWEEIEDIKIQIQYGTLIVEKLSNLTKKEYIRSNATIIKVCTLIKNTIRLNIAEEIFTKEQILLLKEGVPLILKKNIDKKELLKLNRELRKEGLMTMPAWE